MSARCLGYKNDSTTPPSYTDAGQIDGWAQGAVSHLAQISIMTGSGGMFYPQNPATRAEAAQVIYNLLTHTGGDSNG